MDNWKWKNSTGYSLGHIAHNYCFLYKKSWSLISCEISIPLLCFMRGSNTSGVLKEIITNFHFQFGQYPIGRNHKIIVWLEQLRFFFYSLQNSLVLWYLSEHKSNFTVSFAFVCKKYLFTITPCVCTCF